MSLFASRQSDGHDDPSWPGLVDIFAFTLVLVVFLMAAALEQPQPKDVEKARQEFGESKIGETGEDLRKRLPSETVRPPDDQNEIIVQGPEKNPISFRINEYELDSIHIVRLESIAVALDEVVKKNLPIRIIIDGRADPQEFKNRPLTPPRDNRELSALRAAFVARTIVEKAPDLSKHLHVVGLGEEGEKAPESMSLEDKESYYAPFRRVSIRIQIDEQKLNKQWQEKIKNADNSVTGERQ